MPSGQVDQLIWVYTGNPANVSTSIINPPKGALVIDTTNAVVRLKTTGLGDNSGYSILLLNTEALDELNVDGESFLNGIVHIGENGNIGAELQLQGATSGQLSIIVNPVAGTGTYAFRTGTGSTYTLLDSGGPLITPTSTPASASAAGVAGTIAWDASFIYVCVSTNSWKRVAIATW